MPGTSSETIEQVKKAFRSLFRRRKPVNPAGTVKPSQAPLQPPRPRSASAVAAPEVFLSPNAPTWPISGRSPHAGFYCSPVELPASLGPPLQHRSKSDAGRQPSISDLFSELDATSVRRLSVVEDDDRVPELDGPESDVDTQPQVELDGHQEQVLQAENWKGETKEILENEEQQAQSEEEEDDEEKPYEDEETVEQYVEPADIAIPDDTESEVQSISMESEHDLARNDSANGTVIKDDSSSFYSTDESFDESSTTDDTATASTPRTASVARAELPEYFDEKIPVLAEPPEVMPLTPAPGMAATSGPLEDFPFR